jgi:hypothetical protein
MYRYTPPKSNIWGHSLRKMRPARQRELFGEFLSIAVADHKFLAGSLTVTDYTVSSRGMIINHSAGEAVQRFERLLDIKAQNHSFHSLPPEQVEKCLNELIRDNVSKPDEPIRLMLLQPVAIGKWRINGQEIAISSEITLYYGLRPCISTFLQFETVEQFRYIKRVLEELRFCKLNEKHLKVIKRKTR